MPDLPQIVIDTNVVVAAIRSRRGASYRLIELLGAGRFETHVSVPLLLEYEEAAGRIVFTGSPGAETWEKMIDYFSNVSHRAIIYFRLRPFLKDPGDEMVLEAAVAAGCRTIVSYNKADFAGAELFGVQIVTAKEFLEAIGEWS